jgi:hypothetical protein
MWFGEGAPKRAAGHQRSFLNLVDGLKEWVHQSVGFHWLSSRERRRFQQRRFVSQADHANWLSAGMMKANHTAVNVILDLDSPIQNLESQSKSKI